MTSLESSFQDGKPLELSIIVDTSQKDGRLMVTDQNYKLVFSSHWKHPLRHTEELILEFKKCKNLFLNSPPSKIYFVSGPGSFTGLRVGAAFVKSLGLLFQLAPIYCINSFKITASHVLNKLEPTEGFSVYITSVGNMAFRADYQFLNQVYQNENIFSDGAMNYFNLKQRAYSPNVELCKKNSDICHIEVELEDYISAIKELDQDKDCIKSYTHLDLYPLYLRKSEAEEKYRYDKAKL